MSKHRYIERQGKIGIDSSLYIYKRTTEAMSTFSNQRVVLFNISKIFYYKISNPMYLMIFNEFTLSEIDLLSSLLRHLTLRHWKREAIFCRFHFTLQNIEWIRHECNWIPFCICYIGDVFCITFLHEKLLNSLMQYVYTLLRDFPKHSKTFEYPLLHTGPHTITKNSFYFILGCRLLKPEFFPRRSRDSYLASVPSV